jgi:hypothetical protein
MKFFEGQQVGGNILTYGSVRTATRLYSPNPSGFEGLMTNEKLSIFFRENVVGYGRDIQSVAQFLAQGQHERSFAAANRPADAYGKRAPGKIPRKWQGASMKASGMIEVFVSVAVACMFVEMV